MVFWNHCGGSWPVNSMKIQQAIFTSSDRGQIKGYQLVAMSEDIDRNIVRELQRWSPSHMDEDAPAKWTINYFPVSKDRVAVTRTILGGPEYSSRGGLQVVTTIAVLENEQFAAYDNNAMLVARTALALGWLRLPSDIPSRLEAIELPDRPLATSNDTCQLEVSLLRSLTELLENKKRIAIVGAQCPLIMAESLIQNLSAQGRRMFSFTTGLLPTLCRPFQAHFLARTTPLINQSLKSESISLVEL